MLTLGDELLLGLTANGHLTFIGAQLGRRGVTLARNITLTDDAAAIAAQFRESWARADVVITTGGLGPTCDDRTREAVAAELGEELVFDATIERTIAERFARLGRRMTANNLKQAFRFARGEVLPNPHGTAPGLWLTQGEKVLVMHPGPPNELQPMFMEQVLPRLAVLGLLAPREAYVQVRTAGVGESALETKLQPLFQVHGAALSVAYCAHQGQVDCRLSSPSGALTEESLQRLAGECAALLGEDFLCYGHDSMAKVCADLLRSAERTLATAETATGGLLANSFSDIAGAAKFFAGGCVCSSNEAKMQLLDVPEEILLQHGAVSAENAVAMASGAAEKLGADYGLAICGFAGPCGGTKENPVGTIFVALYSPAGVWSKRLSYPGPRPAVKQRAVMAALDWLRRELVRARFGQIAAPQSTGS
ncbi:MAG TPA: CinA family nicotinamide mononucleotide deamidase-related protein [Candidatus Synoicihabitans sp.]|nr:CinA family nicotinamide mononucleotide deamidase-related protein [Candidatus Synoicihabitans sp.]